MWLNAMQEEVASLENSNTWELIECPPNVKWVFSEKEVMGQTVKRTRLVARGCFQGSEAAEEIYAPVARMTTLRIHLSVATQRGWSMNQLNVKCMFLYGDLDEPVYMKVLVGVNWELYDGNIECKLIKSLYELKQSPQCWYKRFSQTLRDMGFEPSNVFSKFNMTDCKYSAIPMVPKLHIEPSGTCREGLPYRDNRGCHMYFMMGSRPDLSFLYGRSDGTIVDAFVNADFANDSHDRKSETGFFIRVFSNKVIWKNKKQPYMSLSSTEAEYIALATLQQLNDTQYCIKMASTFETKCSKHLSVKHHFVKVLKLVYIDSHNPVADVLTKALPCSKFQFCVTRLGMSKLGGGVEKSNFDV
ncbi:hypothetical protein PR048_000711 [Dryococelus australis]|uniref:Reverse transcriptase Ty1/copia-type domain-containing protein n=1 Tax=Dryococelus australis TaxID=614101 RepID=A0ABQ9IFE9_9NEOP|nr:hypothetical protein PR048_000711 [Dryococelus australis]